MKLIMENWKRFLAESKGGGASPTDIPEDEMREREFGIVGITNNSGVTIGFYEDGRTGNLLRALVPEADRERVEKAFRQGYTYIEYPLPYGIYDVKVTPYSPEDQQRFGTRISVSNGEFALNSEHPRQELFVERDTFDPA